MFEAWEEYLNETETPTRDDLLTMIELALATRDKDWFIALTERLERLG